MSTASQLGGEGVEPAFGLAHAAPPARPLRLAGSRGARAWPAADARESLVEQWVVQDVVLADVAPHVVPGPGGEREHLDDRLAAGFMVFDHVHAGPAAPLIAAHGADPGVEPGQGPLQRLHLTNPAAAVGIGLVQRPG